MRKRSAMLVLVLLASCSGEQQTPLVAKLQGSDLYEKGTNCQGDHYRIQNNQLILFGGNEPQIVGREITLSEKENTVTTTDSSWGKVTVNLVFTFSSDVKNVTVTDIYLSPEPTEQEWQQINIKVGNAKAKFRAYRDALKGLPQMEVCQRADAS